MQEIGKAEVMPEKHYTQSLISSALKLRDDSLAEIANSFEDNITYDGINPSVLAQKYLQPRELEITSLDPELLVFAMQRRQYKVIEVIDAFLRRAYLAHVGTNCITQALVHEARARAKELDKVEDPRKYLLFGLPLSVKEHVGLKGHVLSAGNVAWLDNEPEKDDADLVKALLAVGCVPFVRTTEPQFLMHLECETPIYGTTLNAFNRELTSGGSSGGEGALIGFRGSVMGIGTDIGGSVRCPAGHNGIYGMRPSAHILPGRGLKACNFMQLGIAPTSGPMSSSMKGLDLWMQAILASEPHKTNDGLYPYHWTPIEDVTLPEKPIRVGIMMDDGVVRPHPPVERAINELIYCLERNTNFELVPFKPLDHQRAWELAASIYFADGGEIALETAARGNEEICEMSKFILTENPYVRKLNLHEYTNIITKIKAYRQEYLEHWLSYNIDVLLCPVSPGASQKLNTSRWWGYTSQWNVLDYPSVVFPVSEVDVERDVKPQYTPRNDTDKYNWDNYEPKQWRHAKVSLQLVGRNWDDSRVLAYAAQIEKDFRNRI